MKVVKFPVRSTWPTLCQRPHLVLDTLERKVTEIIRGVKEFGDEALFSYTKQFDKVALDCLEVSPLEVQKAIASIGDSLKDAIRIAKANIEKFHASQDREEDVVETMPGVRCWRKNVPVEKVGLYIPGGSAPLFSSLLMLGVPAKLAGCREIILCTPPDKNGKVAAPILFIAKLLGIETVFKVGGAQAIAAMAYGTGTIPRVYKIFGPGNQYVTMAKMLVQKDGVAIDLPAGPSEVLVIADKTGHPAFIAADLLSQAEHGADSQVIFATDSERLLEKVLDETDRQLKKLPRAVAATEALSNSYAILFENTQEALDFSNGYAPEHLILATSNPHELASQVSNAGSVFLGHYSCESPGDYASGTNHTLPTNGYARSYSGVSLDSFFKKITFQELDAEGINNLGPTIEKLAAAEGLEAHKNAVSLRLNFLNKKKGKV